MMPEDRKPTIEFLIATLKQVVVEHASRNLAEVEAMSWSSETLIEETGIDSFDFVELIFKVEEHFDISIDYNANKSVTEMKTIGELAQTIDRLVARKALT